MSRHPHHYRIAIALAISAGAWGIYWLPQRILEEGGLTGGWGTIAQMIIGVLILIPISIWRMFNGKSSGLELPLTGLLIGAGMGWTLDQWINTTPLFLIIFFILGGIAGIYNLWRVLTGKGLKMGFFNEKEK